MERIKKLCLTCLLLAGAIFSLAAQSHQRASVYVPPVTGSGIGPGDNAFFSMLVSAELEGRNDITAGTDDAADYSLMGSIDSFSLGEYRFNLKLQNNKTGVTLAENGLIYENLDNVSVFTPVIVYSLLTLIPDMSSAPVKNGAWRDKWLFFGFSAFWPPRLYIDDEEKQAVHLGNFGVGLHTEFQFLNFLSLETGAELTTDWLVVDEDTGDKNYQDLMLEVPVLLKVVFKPGVNFLLEPYGGIYLNFPLFGVTKPPMFSWVTGYQHGFKAGSGALLFDFRFAMDLGKSSIVADKDLKYQRYRLSIGVGYKYGVIQKRSRFKEAASRHNN